MDLVNTIGIIRLTIVFHSKVTKYQKINFRMIINTAWPTLIINFQDLLKNQVYQVKEVVLMMMEQNVSPVLVYSALEEKRRKLARLKLWIKMIFGCKVCNLKCMKFLKRIIKIVCLNGFLAFKESIKVKFLIVQTVISSKITNNFNYSFKI